MTPLRPISACLAIAAVSAIAQDIAPKSSERDPVLSALTEGFEDEEMPSVTVDISATSPTEGDRDSAAPDPAPDAPEGDPGVDATTDDAAPAEPEPEGVSVQVEPGRDGSAKVAAAAVKLLAPFPAKPLFLPPAGWRLEHPSDVPSFVEKVPLANGTTISLSIRPHLLVPDADGENVLAVGEPGYDPALRYAQTGTLSAVLGRSIERMDEDARQMSAALDRLSQLLTSLPAAPEAPPKANPAPEPSPVKKQR
jgi:hypothetical protein